MEKMVDLKYTVRTMTKEDVPAALEIWRQTGLPEGTHCLYTWLEVDKEAFNIAVTDSGEVIAACSAVINFPDFAYVGLYCCVEKYRGRGVGKAVWDACMKHIGSRKAGITAVPEKMELYRDRGGFPIFENRWTCVVNETEEPINPEQLSDQVPDGVTIEPFQDSLLHAMLEYDFNLVKYDRKQALELNCKEIDSKTLVAFKNGKCMGFGTIKMNCHKCGQVGPLYADDAAVAEVLLRRLIVSLPQAKGLSVMTINTNSAINDFLKKVNCPATEECPRLYRKEKIDVDTSKIFAFFDLNFCPY